MNVNFFKDILVNCHQRSSHISVAGVLDEFFCGFSIYNFVTLLESTFEPGLEAWNLPMEDLTVHPEAFGLRLQAIQFFFLVGIGSRHRKRPVF